MKTPEDPCRDPASEARDDHASEPRATPETDAITFDPYPWNQNGPGRSHYPDVMCPCEDGEWVKADFARLLERQRDGAMETAKRFADVADGLERQLSEARSQRDELLEALYAIEERFVDGCDTYDDWQFMGETARAAIAAVKGVRNE